MEFARQGQHEESVNEFLDRLFRSIDRENALPRMDVRRFLAAFILDPTVFQLDATTRVQLRLQITAKNLADATDAILKGLLDGSIESFADMPHPLSPVFITSYEMFRVTFEEFARLKGINVSVMLMLAAIYASTPENEEDLENEATEFIMAMVGKVANIVLTTAAEDFTPGVRSCLASFIPQTLEALNEEARERMESSAEGLDRLNALIIGLSARLVLLNQRIAASD